MRFTGTRFSIVLVWICLLTGGFPLARAEGATLYKSYVIKQARGFDILCDPYIVLKNDSVSQLILKRGEMARKDFPEFLEIFRQINPGVANLNRIRIGQHIFIPIKKLKKNSLPGQTTGTVTIPFVTISKLQKVLMENTEPYTVKRGDMISVLISQRWGGPRGKQSFRDGMKLFKRANTAIADMNLVLPGQRIYLPNLNLKQNPLYRMLLSGKGQWQLPAARSPGHETLTRVDSTDSVIAPRKVKKRRPPPTNLQRAATALNAKLLAKGTYHFPSAGQDDLRLDLSRSPVLKFKDGKNVVVATRQKRLPDLDSRRAVWKDVDGIRLPQQAPLPLIMDRLASVMPNLSANRQIKLDDHGLIVRARARWVFENVPRGRREASTTMLTPPAEGGAALPEPLAQYLAGHRVFTRSIDPNGAVKDKPAETGKTPRKAPDVTRIDGSGIRQVVPELVRAMGYRFTGGVPIIFSYAGIQVKAVSNLIAKPDGNLLLVDFEELMGDAIEAIRNSHVEIIQLKKRTPVLDGVRRLLVALKCPVVENPTLTLFKAGKAVDISATLPGLLIKPGGKVDILLTTRPISAEASRLLAGPGTRVIIAEPGSGQTRERGAGRRTFRFRSPLAML